MFASLCLCLLTLLSPETGSAAAVHQPQGEAAADAGEAEMFFLQKVQETNWFGRPYETLTDSPIYSAASLPEVEGLDDDDAAAAAAAVTAGAEASSAESSSRLVLGGRHATQKKRVRWSQFFFRKRVVFPFLFTLLFLAGFAAAAGGRPAAVPRLIEEEEEILEEEEEEKKPPEGPPEIQVEPQTTLMRIGAVKKLLPAAGMLATAVHTAEARRLVSRAEQYVGEASLEAPGVTDSARLRVCLDKALEALQLLHQVALEKAEELYDDQEWMVELDLPPIDDETREAMNKLELIGGDKTVQPFECTYTSMHEVAERLSQRSREMYEKIIEKGIFENEQNGEALLTTALAIESFKSARVYGEHLNDHAQAVAKGTFHAYLTLSLADAEESIAGLEVDLARLHVQAAAAERRARAAHTPEEPAAFFEQLNVEGPIKEMKENIAQVENALRKLREQSDALHDAASVADIRRIMDKVRVLQEDTFSLVSKASKVGASLPLPEDVSDDERSFLMKMAENAIERNLASQETVEANLKELMALAAQKKMEEGDFWLQQQKQPLHALDEAFPRGLVKNLEAIFEAGKRQNIAVAGWAEELKNIEVLHEALDASLWAGLVVRAAAKREGYAFLSGLRYHLFDFMEKDVAVLMNLINVRDSHMSAESRELSMELKKNFKHLLKDAKESSKLRDVADAVADMRMCMIGIQKAVYVHPNESSPRR